MVASEPVETDSERDEDRGGGAPVREAAWALAVALGACLVLLLVARHFDPQTLHVHGRLNDQAGYVTTARILADEGELRSGILLPAYVENERSRLYMPGHYVALATAYRALGYGPGTSLVPSLVSFVLCVVLAYDLARRCAGRRAGLVAGLLVACCPPLLAYAFTAMAELTLAAAATFAVWLLVALPGRLRAWAAPVLLAIPFLFRETAALLAAPAVLLVLAGPGRARLRAALALAASVVLLYGLLAWQVATGKESPPLSWVTGGQFNYSDATYEAPRLGASEWMGAVVANVGRNVETLRTEVFDEASVEVLFLVLLVALTLAVLAGAGLRARGRPLSLGTGLAALGIVLLSATLYDVKGMKLVRALLFLAPLLAAGAAIAWTPRRATRSGARSPRARWISAAAALLLVIGAERASAAAGASFRKFSGITRTNTRTLEALGHDDEQLLITHFSFGLDYAVEHYPVRWSFLPANDETFRRMAARYPVGTVIVPDDYLGARLSAWALQEDGLVARGTLKVRGDVHHIFQRAARR